MKPIYSPQSQSERLVAAGRVVLSGCSLLAVWLDPAEPAKLAPIAYALLVTYLAYSVVVAAMVWRRFAVRRGQGLVAHASDLVFFSLLVYFTAGPSSPFVVFFVFALVAAALRWGWHGTLWTAVVALAAFVGISAWFALVEGDRDFELYRFIIRLVYLGVIAGLLAYLGAHEQRTQRVLALLASSPRPLAPPSLEDVADHALRQAAGVVGVERTILVWSEREEPWMEVAELRAGTLTLGRQAPDGLTPWVAEGLEESVFLWSRGRGERTMVLRATDEAPREWPGDPLSFRLADMASAAASGITAPVRGETVEGRLLLLGKVPLTSDDLLLAEIVATAAAARLDHFYLDRQLRQRAAHEERIRLARDLHDGLLQSLTGVALRVMAIRGLLDSEPDAARRRLEELQRLIAAEQRELRFFIQELSPAPAGEGDSLEERLEELVERVEREWDLAVEIQLAGLEHGADDLRARDVYLLTREAVINAARHGDASRIQLTVEWAKEGWVTIQVRDDGRGFPFVGHYDEKALAALGLGPRTLRERVSSLAGSLDLVSTTDGAHLQIVLPRPEAGA